MISVVYIWISYLIIFQIQSTEKYSIVLCYWFRSLEEKQLKQKQQELAEQQQKVEESWLQIKFTMIIDWHVYYNGGRDDECIDDNDDAEQIVAAVWW